MPIVELTDTFNKLYAQLPGDIRKKVQKAIYLLSDDPRHPSLRTKPIQGAPEIFEACVDRRYRMTFERLPGDKIRLRVVDTQDDALKKP